MNFVIAFQAEARPMIDHLHLKKVEGTQFPHFQSDEHNLVICGMGKARARQGAEYLLTHQEEKNLPWLNLGIAGHGNLNQGTAFLAGKIEDDESRETFFPPLIFPKYLPVSSIISCKEPSSKYRPEYGYDMEAHAFYKALAGHSLRELIQVVKIVSDNPCSPLEQVNPKMASKWIEQNLENVMRLVRDMEKCWKEIRTDPEVENLHQKLLSFHRFSVTRRHQLHDLIRHLHAHKLDPGEMIELVQNAKGPAEAISSAELWLFPQRRLS
jgi:hypothetical protein